MKNKVATTIKLENTLYDEFKVLGIRHKLSLQGLVEKSVYKYVTEEKFREELNNFFLPITVIVTAVTSSFTSSLAA